MGGASASEIDECLSKLIFLVILVLLGPSSTLSHQRIISIQ